LIPQFKELRPGIFIVSITGHNSRELELKVRSFMINYYMLKPFRVEEIEEMLNFVSKKMRKEVAAA